MMVNDCFDDCVKDGSRHAHTKSLKQIYESVPCVCVICRVFVYVQTYDELTEKKNTENRIKCKNMQYLYPYSAVHTIHIKDHVLCWHAVYKLGALPGSDNEITNVCTMYIHTHKTDMQTLSTLDVGTQSLNEWTKL